MCGIVTWKSSARAVAQKRRGQRKPASISQILIFLFEEKIKVKEDRILKVSIKEKLF